MADATTAALSSVPSGILTSAQYNAQKAATPQKTEMGQTEFLTLFTTQLKNQNPLEPVKNEAFVAQLAQFSQLEATTAMKGSMEGLVAALGNQRIFNAAGLIGKTVAVPDGPVTVTDTTVSQGVINLPNGADGIQVQVRRPPVMSPWRGTARTMVATASATAPTAMWPMSTATVNKACPPSAPMPRSKVSAAPPLATAPCCSRSKAARPSTWPM
jgi:hypothetical protein